MRTRGSTTSLAGCTVRGRLATGGTITISMSLSSRSCKQLIWGGPVLREGNSRPVPLGCSLRSATSSSVRSTASRIFAHLACGCTFLCKTWPRPSGAAQISYTRALARFKQAWASGLCSHAGARPASPEVHRLSSIRWNSTASLRRSSVRSFLTALRSRTSRLDCGPRLSQTGSKTSRLLWDGVGLTRVRPHLLPQSEQEPEAKGSTPNPPLPGTLKHLGRVRGGQYLSKRQVFFVSIMVISEGSICTATSRWNGMLRHSQNSLIARLLASRKPCCICWQRLLGARTK